MFFYPRSKFSKKFINNNLTLGNWIIQSVENKKISPRDFWTMREFHSPGYFHIDKNGISEKEYLSNFKYLKSTSNEKILPFLFFKSAKINSLEYLVNDSILTNQNSKNTILILNTPTDEIVKYPDGTFVVRFIRPIEVMKDTNGYLDYGEHDITLIKGKHWFVYSEIKP